MEPEAIHRLRRLEELRRDLHRANAAHHAYALETLLSLLWVEEGRQQAEVACALCDYSPQPAESEIPPCAARFCARLGRTVSDGVPPPPPGLVELMAWAGQALIAILNASLDVLKAAARTQMEPQSGLIPKEVAVCRDALRLARHLKCAEAAEPCVRLLRLFPSELVRSAGPLARQATTLRDAAARTLGALSPDALFPLWQALLGPERDRRNLLPALDYLTDPGAIRYLVRLLERRRQWADGEMIGWFVVRAFERIGDRRALPALRQLAAEDSSSARLALPWRRGAPATQGQTSAELAREARRVIEGIEYGRNTRERASLLRPADPPAEELLRPAEGNLIPDDPEPAELLRPEESPTPSEP